MGSAPPAAMGSAPPAAMRSAPPAAMRSAPHSAASTPTVVPVQKPSKPQDTTPAIQPQSVSTGAKPKIKQQQDPTQLLESMVGLSLKSKVPQTPKNIAKRPNRGKLGRPIDLVANYFLLKVKDISIYHYDVDIIYVRARRKDSNKDTEKVKEDNLMKGKSVLNIGRTAKEDAEKKVTHLEHAQKRAPGKERCRKIIRELVLKKKWEQYTPVYDGQKNIYTTKLLPFSTKEIYLVSLDEENRFIEFEVHIQPVEKVGGTGNAMNIERFWEVINKKSNDIPYEVIMALDTVLCHRNPPFSQVQVGRSFFRINQNPVPLGEGIEIWFGYNQSLHFTERGPAVVVNFAAKAFHTSGPVLDYISEILRVDINTLKSLQNQQVKIVKEALAKVKVQVTHGKYPRKYIVQGLSKLAAKDQLVDINGTKKSVADYFFQTYKKRLEYPHLPCLHMRTNTNTTFIPLEVCEVVPHQPKLGKLSGRMTSDMIKKTAIKPDERFAAINNEMKQFKHVSGDTMDSFGLSLNYQFLELRGRVLEPPPLRYGAQASTKPQPGKWQMQGLTFLQPVEKCSFVIISFVNERFCHRGNLENCASTLCKASRTLGMGMENVREIKIFGPRDTVSRALEWAKQCNVTFAIVVLSPRDDYHTYEEVKFVGDIKLNLVTQCLKDEVVSRKFNFQVAGNVLLKINTKIGGTNQGLLNRPPMFTRPVIIFGADAAHSPRGFACPSIASVVGSLDAYPYRYAVSCQVQPNPEKTKLSQEIILGMKDMVKGILHRFRMRTRGKSPEKILFFRDGVSEGQFSIVLDQEIPLIREACKEELDGFIPPMTFLVVQKRHQTRFRPKNPRDGVGKSGNIPPGTTVDTDVTHPVFFDFFICSQEGIQGTSKPAHYTVLLDENNLSADELQNMCYHLCYTYARCTRSISVPPPVMYADLACTRAKKYADLFLRDENRSVASSGSGPQRLPEEAERAINSTMAEIADGMFYV